MNTKTLSMLLAIVFCMSCGLVKKKDDSTETTIAIADGTYLVGANPTDETIPARTLCADGTRPALAGTAASISTLQQLARFGDIVVNSLTVTVAGKVITKVWSRDANLAQTYPNANTAYTNPTCTITWTGAIVKNENTTFQEAGSYEVTWEPATCQMELHNFATNGSESGLGMWITPAITAANAGPFTTASSTTPRDSWTTKKSGSVVTLTMPDSVAATQTMYTCPNDLKVVKQVWTLQ